MSFGIINKPRKPGATMRVWEIADEITEREGRLARRKEVIEAFAEEGGNQNTASTQYYYWKDAQSDRDGSGNEARDTPDGYEGIQRLTVERDGSVRVPSGLIRPLGVGPGEPLAARLEDGMLTIIDPMVALRRVQDNLAELKSDGESVVDDFIARRRADWGEE